jgi:CRP-like cAMP-binding protein
VEDDLVEVGDAGPGEPIGLIAEILRKPQPNSVTACCLTEVYELDFDSIEETIGGPDQPVAKIIRELVKQLDETQALLTEAQT